MVRGGKSRILVFISIYILIFSSIAISVEDSDTTSTAEKPEDKGGLTKTDETTERETEAETTSYDWLENKTTEARGEIFDDSLAIIALLGSGQTDLTQLVDRLKGRMDEAGCWPDGGCRVKDTAIATLAMYLSGQDKEAEAGANWLKNARIPGLKTGEWWLVIKGSTPEGSCSISFEDEKAKTFSFVEDKIKEIGGKYYINLIQISAGASSKLRSRILPKINADCSNLAGSIITLLYKPNSNTFFIQRSDTAANVEIKIANTCFGETKGSANCDYESSLLATWALVEMGENGLSLEDIGDTVYLQSKIKPNNLKHLALLNRILYRASNVAPSFVKDLASKQRPGGDFEGDVFTTSLAVFSLLGNSEQADVVNRGAAYIERRRSPKDGSWDNSVKSTSMALITLNGVDLSKGNVGASDAPTTSGDSGAKTEKCDNLLDDDGDELPDCGDNDCEVEIALLCSNDVADECEEDVDCGGFCQACEDVSVEEPREPSAGCTSDAECDSGQECVGGECREKEEIKEGCTDDADCGDGEECVSGKCIAENGSLWWLWLLIILIVLGGGGAFFYIKYVNTGRVDIKHLFRKKKPGQTFEQFKTQQAFKPQPLMQRPVQRQQAQGPQQVRRPVAPATKSKEDLELEKSLREAERIMKGK